MRTMSLQCKTRARYGEVRTCQMPLGVIRSDEGAKKICCVGGYLSGMDGMDAIDGMD
jgi:hypothetical protein